jgi:hypothetical protein
MDADEQALGLADRVIKALLDTGQGDYSKYRQEIADLWGGEYGLWEGNDECTTELNDPVLKDLRCIQEDHYDQHMDSGYYDDDGLPIPNDDKPSWDDMLCSAGDYIFYAD